MTDNIQFIPYHTAPAGDKDISYLGHKVVTSAGSEVFVGKSDDGTVGIRLLGAPDGGQRTELQFRISEEAACVMAAMIQFLQIELPDHSPDAGEKVDGKEDDDAQR